MLCVFVRFCFGVVLFFFLVRLHFVFVLQGFKTVLFDFFKTD